AVPRRDMVVPGPIRDRGGPSVAPTVCCCAEGTPPVIRRATTSGGGEGTRSVRAGTRPGARLFHVRLPTLGKAWLVLVGSILVLGLGALLLWDRQRFQHRLDRAKTLIGTGRMDQARRVLVELSVDRPGHAEVDYLLGLCEYTRGRADAALRAWS